MKLTKKEALYHYNNIREAEQDPTKIACSTCIKKSAKEFEDGKGCFKCGGYGFTYFRYQCPKTGKFGWFRPGAFTIYQGKSVRDRDGRYWTYEAYSKKKLRLVYRDF